MMNPHPPPSSSPPNRHPHSNFGFNSNPPQHHAGTSPHQRGRSVIEARRIRRVEMADIQTIAVSSLQQAMRAVLEVAHGRHDIVINTVRVDHASAMRELPHVKTAWREWRLRNKRRLRKLSIADGLLTIVGDVMLSVLTDRPTDQPILALLRRCAQRIKRCAGEVGELPAVRGASLQPHPPPRQ